MKFRKTHQQFLFGIQNAKTVIAQEDWNVSMMTKIKKQSNKSFIKKLLEKKFLLQK